MTEQRAEADLVRRTAWAKINLTLHLTGRRDDGYHELDSLIVFADIGDGLEIAPGPQISLEVTGPFAAALRTADSDNLVVAAARALAARYGVEAGARLRLDKQLPVAAGLGGGSADAAAALHGLVEFWGLDAPAAELNALAASLGADVPVCLAGRPSFVAGIGERIVPAPSPPPAWLVLANPGVPLSTAAVFAEFKGGFSKPARWREPISDLRAWAARLAACRNDLEGPALALVPEVREVLATLRDTAGCMLARMSGSGATCFGLYAVESPATAAARRMAATRPGWWVRAAPLRTAAVSGSS
ncbi:MAG: 4-(cytidine 5'-diphospho)-2-C-methyl-D-erythritol kinase [Alphaproteobacteria bacterium]